MKIFSFVALIISLLASSNSAELTTVQNADNSVSCTLSGTYENGTDVSACNELDILSLSVPAGVQLDLTNVAEGAEITFTGTTTFGTQVRLGIILQLGRYLYSR